LRCLDEGKLLGNVHHSHKLWRHDILVALLLLSLRLLEMPLGRLQGPLVLLLLELILTLFLGAPPALLFGLALLVLLADRDLEIHII